MTFFTSSLLLLLTLQRSGSSILLHEAGQNYSTGLAILLGELLKQAICVVVSMYSIRQDLNIRLPVISPSATATSFRTNFTSALYDLRETFNTFISRAISKDAWKVFLPAALYVIQNNLYLFASSRLQPSTFQVIFSRSQNSYISGIPSNKIYTLTGSVATSTDSHGISKSNSSQKATWSKAMVGTYYNLGRSYCNSTRSTRKFRWIFGNRI